MGKNHNQRKKIVSVATLRILACLMIFFHHYLKSVGVINSYTLSPVIAIGMFTLFAGMFSREQQNHTLEWILRKTTRIIVPLWIILVPLILLNLFVKVKEKGIWSNVLELMGMQLFIEPLFESTWFVTLILILFFAVYVSKLSISYGNYIFLGNMILAYLLCSVFRGLDYITDIRLFFWILSFGVGYIFSESLIRFFLKIDEILFEELGLGDGAVCVYVAELTYSFYLVHAPVLYVAFDVLEVNAEFGLYFSIAISFFLSIAIQKIDYLFSRRLKSLHL